MSISSLTEICAIPQLVSVPLNPVADVLLPQFILAKLKESVRLHFELLAARLNAVILQAAV